MPLFDQIERRYLGPAKYAEASFTFLTRSARVEVERIRNVLEEWFSALPTASQSDLRSRFRSNDEQQHAGAFFELYSHALVLAHGFTADVHPPSSRMTRPDFLVRREEQPLFYLEATVSVESDSDRAARRRRQDLYDTLDRLDSPNFVLDFQIEVASEQAPSARLMRRFLERMLANLDPDVIDRRVTLVGAAGYPTWTWSHGGWRVQFTALPKSPEIRGAPGVRPLGVFPVESRLVTAHVAIRKALEEKASRYGELELPLVVAVNCLDEFSDEGDVADALLGSREVVVNVGGIPGARRFQRATDGSWGNAKSPRNKTVSAALVACQLRPWSIAGVTPEAPAPPVVQKTLEPGVIARSPGNSKPVWRRDVPTDWGRDAGLVRFSPRMAEGTLMAPARGATKPRVALHGCRGRSVRRRAGAEAALAEQARRGPDDRAGGHEILALAHFPCIVSRLRGSAPGRRSSPQCQD